MRTAMQTDRFSVDNFPPTPLPNTYWVEPGSLLAGEYPLTRVRGDALERLQQLRNAGVTVFIDLTEVGELQEYQSYLPELAERGPIQHRRFEIPDHDLPATPDVVRRALDAIDQALANGECVYVHCRAGIGRTGTIIGCYLARHGLTGEAALKRLAQLWKKNARSREWPSSPETDKQADYVREWREAPPPAANVSVAVVATAADRVTGAFMGMAVAEAVCLAQIHRDRSVDAWGSDTAMTVCLAESLFASKGKDARDQMERYLRWTREGIPPGSAAPTDVPAAVKRALATWQWSRKPLAGSHDPKNHDPHSLARTVAVVLTRRTSAEQVIELAAEASRTTQQSPVVLDACRLFAAFLFDLLAGRPKAEVFDGQSPALQALVRGRELKASVAQLLTDAATRKNNAASSNNDVVKVFASALHAFEENSQYAAGLRLFTQSPQVSASAAAVYGALAGAHGGITRIPSELIAAVQHRAFLETMAARFQR